MSTRKAAFCELDSNISGISLEFGYIFPIVRPFILILNFQGERFPDLRCDASYGTVHGQGAQRQDRLRSHDFCRQKVDKLEYPWEEVEKLRFSREDKRGKLPRWMQEYMEQSHTNLSIDEAASIARRYAIIYKKISF